MFSEILTIPSYFLKNNIYKILTDLINNIMNATLLRLFEQWNTDSEYCLQPP